MGKKRSPFNSKKQIQKAQLGNFVMIRLLKTISLTCWEGQKRENGPSSIFMTYPAFGQQFDFIGDRTNRGAIFSQC
jgi:hypothetical protein